MADKLTRPIEESPNTAAQAESHRLAKIRDFQSKPHPNPGAVRGSTHSAKIAGTKVAGGTRLTGGTK